MDVVTTMPKFAENLQKYQQYVKQTKPDAQDDDIKSDFVKMLLKQTEYVTVLLQKYQNSLGKVLFSPQDLSKQLDVVKEIYQDNHLKEFVFQLHLKNINIKWVLC